MIKAGYIQRSGYPALDAHGNRHGFLEICIEGRIYAIKMQDMRRTLYTGSKGTVWHIRQDYGRHLDIPAGVFSLSASKRAVNITPDNGRRYTVSNAALRNILSGRCSYSSVAEIGTADKRKAKTVSSYQSPISPWIAAQA